MSEPGEEEEERPGPMKEWVPKAFVAAEKARREGIMHGYAWHTQVLAGELLGMSKDIDDLNKRLNMTWRVIAVGLGIMAILLIFIVFS